VQKANGEQAVSRAFDFCPMRLIIPMIIQTSRLEPSGAVWTDEASNVNRLDPSGADQIDVEHQATDRAVGGSDSSRRAKRQVRRPAACAVSLLEPMASRVLAVL
jgi:hypothetical protein